MGHFSKIVLGLEILTQLIVSKNSWGEPRYRIQSKHHGGEQLIVAKNFWGKHQCLAFGNYFGPNLDLCFKYSSSHLCFPTNIKDEIYMCMGLHVESKMYCRISNWQIPPWWRQTDRMTRF